MYATRTSTPVHLIPEPRSGLISALPLCSICFRTLRLLDLSLVSACYPSYQYVVLGILDPVEEPLFKTRSLLRAADLRRRAFVIPPDGGAQ